MPSWPIVARPAVVDALAEGLARRPARSHLLRGPSGVGKTTVAAAVAATLGAQGRTIVPVVALAELSEVPLGALAPLLSAPVEGASDVAARLSELVAIVGRHADSYLIIVDDAPLLDEASAAALYQLVRVFGVPALLTARDEHALEGAVAAYGTDQADNWHGAADYVHRLLHGTPLANLPFVQSANVSLTLNLRTARAVGLQVPAAVIARAGQVIE